MSDITIRLYQEGDEHGIVDLLNTVFEPWPQFDIPCSSLDHWIWKHKENPIGESIIVVAEKNDEIIGSMHSMLKRVKIGYSIVPAISGLDEATHPDFRGMGIYSKIRDMMYEERENSGIQYMYGGTTNPILIASSKRRGEHTYPHNLKTFVKLYDLDLYFKKNPRKYTTILKYGYLTLKLLNSVLTNRNREKNRYPNIQVEKIERFDDDINDFCNKITSYYNFIIQRNKERARYISSCTIFCSWNSKSCPNKTSSTPSSIPTDTVRLENNDKNLFKIKLLSRKINSFSPS